MEPNGYNPVLKLIEKFSPYHIEHEEQSFTARQIKRWLREADFKIVRIGYINLVPFFCPDWLAKLCKFFEPFVEKVPGLRQLCCGQVIIYAEKFDLNPEKNNSLQL